MKPVTEMFIIFLVIAVISVCLIFQPEKETQTVSEPVQETALATLDSSRAVEWYREDDSTETLKRFRVYFLVPIDFTREEVVAHAEAYTEAMKAEGVFAMSLWYYDDEVYRYETPVALVDWAPGGRHNNVDNVPPGDYSKHILIVEHSIYDDRYELTPDEKRLYEALYECFIEQLGYNIPHYITADNMAAFEHIADEYQTTVERLSEIREKAAMRRQYPETFCMDGVCYS